MVEHMGEAQAFEVEAETLVGTRVRSLAGGVGHRLSSHVDAPAQQAVSFHAEAESVAARPLRSGYRR